MDLGEIQELIDTTQDELTEDDLVEKSASEPMPNEEAEDIEVPDNELTLEILQKCYSYSRWLLILL